MEKAMNLAGGCASMIAAIHFLEKQSGHIPQHFFGPDFLWMWGLLAAGWGLIGVIFFFRIIENVVDHLHG
jgi:hypothetical protein